MSALSPDNLPTERLNLLYRLSQAFNSSLNLDEVLNRVMDEVIAATHAERGFVMLGKSGGELAFRVARGLDQTKLNAPEFQVSRGVVEQVAREGNPILTSDAQTDERFMGRQSIMLMGLRSILCVPLMIKATIIGVIYVDNRIQAGIFARDDLELLNAIASNAAIAIENARLFQETQEQLQSLKVLYEISSDLTATLELERILTACLERVMEVFGVTAASIMTLEGDHLVFQVAIGEKSEQIKPFHLHIGQGIAGWAVQNVRGTIANDAQSDPRFYPGVDEQSGFQTRSLMAVPLVVNNRAIGVIEVFNKTGGFAEADLNLLTTIASSAAIAIENARLYEVAVEKGRLERELQMARRVQNSLMPRYIPQIDGWELAAYWQPAREVGGDYYDIFPDQGGYGLVIADVTDKGMPAALFMAFTRSIIRASMDRTQIPSEGIRHANRLICAESVGGLYVSLFFAELHPASGEVYYVNAGHNPPLFYGQNPEQLNLLATTGYQLGMEAEGAYDQQTITLSPGDFIFLYTDGVIDALNPQGEVFGMERLQKIILSNRMESANGLINSIKGAIDGFTLSTSPFDDITFIVAKRI